MCSPPSDFLKFQKIFRKFLGYFNGNTKILKIRFPEYSGILNSRKFSIPELQDSRSKKIRKWPPPTTYGTARE